MRRTSFFFLIVAFAFVHIQGKTTEYTSPEVDPIDDDTALLKDIKLKEERKINYKPAKRDVIPNLERLNTRDSNRSWSSVDESGPVRENRDSCPSRRSYTREKTRCFTERQLVRNVRKDFGRRLSLTRTDARRRDVVDQRRVDDTSSTRRITEARREAQNKKTYQMRDLEEVNESRRRRTTKSREPVRIARKGPRDLQGERNLKENQIEDARSGVDRIRSDREINKFKHVNYKLERRLQRESRRTIVRSRKTVTKRRTDDTRKLQKFEVYSYPSRSHFLDEIRNQDDSRKTIVPKSSRNERTGFDLDFYSERIVERQRRIEPGHVRREDTRTRRSQSRDGYRRVDRRMDTPLKAERITDIDAMRHVQRLEKRTEFTFERRVARSTRRTVLQDGHWVNTTDVSSTTHALIVGVVALLGTNIWTKSI